MSNQLQITGGAKVRALEGVITGTSGILGSVPLGAANGVATLDSGGKVPVSQLPSSVVTYLGTWNAATNTPTLTNGVGDAGDMYICNVAGTVNFGAGPVVFAVGDWVLYGSGTWQKSNGQNGTVTSVGATITGGAIGITGSPITTAGTLAFAFAGTSGQYVNGAGNLTTFPTLITSIGLSMPSAFSVANSPLTANGSINVTGAGTTGQYIRGDGTLAAYNPGSGGGGSSQTFYFNGGVASSVIGYEQMSTTANTGTSTDFSINADGYIASFLTDSGSPNQLNIPAGNWNFEIYFNSSSSGGTPRFYVELYKYASSTFTLIATSSANPEYITNGTAVDLYTTALAVPATTLTVTDRLAVRVYVIHSSKTITMHTQDSNLSSVITTFSTGITALNGLTAQVQNFAVGTGGSDFNILSVTDTHTFNLPTASATKRGALSSADWSTFNSKQSTLTFSSPLVNTSGTVSIPAATSSVNGYLTSTDWATFNGKQAALSGTGIVKSTAGTISYLTDNSTNWNTAYNRSLTSAAVTGTTTKTLTLNQQDGGTITASWTDINTDAVTSVFGRTGAIVAVSGDYNTDLVTEGTTNLYFNNSRARLALSFAAGSGAYNSTTGVITIPTNNTQITNGANYITLASLSAGTGISYNNTTGVITSTITQYTDALARAAISLTTTGTSGAATYNSTTGVLNIPQYIGGVTSVFGRTGAVVATEGDYSLTQLGDVTITSPTTGQVLKYNGTIWINDTDANTGTVTSVALSAPTGFSVSGSPVTSSGTLALAFASGYSLPTTASQTTWDTAYTNRITSLTTTGASGSATLVSNTLNIPTYTLAGLGGISLTSLSATTPLSYNNTTGVFTIQVANTSQSGYLSSTDWNTFNGKGSGTVTSVAALTLDTTGTDLSSSVATGTTTPVITLNVPTASAANRGALSSADWSTFNGKESVLTFSSPLVRTTNTISIPVATTSVNGYLSSTDWTTFNNKQGAITLTTTGTSGAATLVGNTLNIPQYSGGGSMAIGGSITSATAGSVLYAGASGVLAQSNAQLFFDYTNNRLGIGTASPLNKLHISDGTNSTSALFENPSGTTEFIGLKSTSGTVFFGNVSNNIYFEVGGSERMRITSGGLVGVGTLTVGSTLQVNGNAAIGYSASTAAPTNGLAVSGNIVQGTTLASWGSAFAGGVIQAKNASLLGYVNSAYLTANAYFTNTTDNYIATDFATRYAQVSGVHRWETAVSGTAGTALSWVTAMTLNTSYNLGIGTATIGSKLQVNGNAAIGYSASTAAPTNGLAVSGNVGIGTNTPAEMLDLNITTTADAAIRLYNLQASYASAVAFKLKTATQEFHFGLGGGSRSDIATNAYYIVDQTNGKFRFVAKNNGDFALGGNILTALSQAYISATSSAFAVTLPLTLATTANASTIAATGYSLTGANAQSLFDLAGTWNTTGNPTAIKLNITNTASGSTSNLIDLQVGGVSKFKVDKTGAVTATSFFESSDSRLKTLIQDNYQTKGIASITPKLYTKNGKVELGYYAQDFVGILDSAVSKGSDDMLSLSYREVLVAKVYALEQRIKELENK